MNLACPVFGTVFYGCIVSVLFDDFDHFYNLFYGIEKLYYIWCGNLRMTLLLGPPGAGKTTLLLALAGKLDRDLKVLSHFFLYFSLFYNDLNL